MDKIENIENLNVDDISFYYRRRDFRWESDEAEFYIALGGLRSLIGHYTAIIAVMYEVDVEEALTVIFPMYPEQE